MWWDAMCVLAWVLSLWPFPGWNRHCHPRHFFCHVEPVGVMHALGDASSAKGIVVAFLSNHCPFVKHLADEFAEFARNFIERGGAVFAIMPNDIEGYPDDAPPLMAEESVQRAGRLREFLPNH